MKKILTKLNYPLLFLMLVYSGFGLLMIFSASSVSSVLRYQVPTNYFFIRQAIWLAVGYVVGIFVIGIPTKFYRFFSKIAMFGSIGLLALLFVGGKVAGGALSWYDMGSFNIQPSEVMKLIMIIYLASYFNRISNKKNLTAWNMFYPLIFVLLVCVLVALQPDLGGALIFAGIAGLIFISIPIGKRFKRKVYKILFFGFLIALASLGLFGKSILNEYQARRLFGFTTPCTRYTEDTGYQVCNGFIAIHNGGLTGVGLGNSTQKYLYLPEAHTDFIFPIICEELGMIAGIVVVLGYFLMLFIILGIAKDTDNLRNSVLAYGIFSYLLLHILVNLLGVLGLIPLTGVPLPFLSYGGSYNITLVISLFIVQRINIENKLSKENKRINK